MAAQKSTSTRRASPPLRLAEQAARGLAAFLPSRRWFGGKQRTIRDVALGDASTPVPGTQGILAIYRVAYAGGEEETYLVPVRPLHPGGWADAMEDGDFGIALVEAIRRGDTLRGTEGVFRFIPTPALSEILPGRAGAAKAIGGEQSNTSVVLDQAAVLKLIRKLGAGPHPDYEVTAALTAHTRFREAPRLAGSIDYETDGRPGTTLAVLQEFVPGQGDAWEAMQARLAEYYAAAEEQPAFARTLAAADAKEAQRLGALTGRLHTALAAEDLPPALRAESIRAADVEGWLQGMQAQLDDVLATLRDGLATLPARAEALARTALQQAERIRADLEALRALAGEPVAKLRLHGDYHLGQVLLAADRLVILDFEGEPTRPLAERRSKQCALKDVAGMLRSFAYAAEAARVKAADATPDDRAVADRLAAWGRAWEEAVRTAFLHGYLEETWERGAPFLPRVRATLEAVLRAFEIDKTVYEVQYELMHRPDWTWIPLTALAAGVAEAPRARRQGRLQLGEGPFRFVACLELREFVGVRAVNERQLAERIEEVPLDSIYYHTHAFFLRHRFLAGTYPNDFATWAAVQVGDRVLGERLAMVDPTDFATLQALREELAAVIDDHLRPLQVVPGVIFGEPFDFIQSRIVEVPTELEVRSLQDFRDILLDVDASAIYFHLVEARMRLGRGQNDFAAWLDRGLGLPRLAARVRAVDPYSGSLERTRMRLIQLCDAALREEAGR
jgi:maltose alpha-D-glucosyltransferase/alpha-amylase